jgi:tripartite-type tricarboxylate transporter receptor subunit TctC
MHRVSRWLSALFLLVALVAGSSAFAQGYPNRPVRIIVPFPAGGPADALGRVLADQLN